MINLKSQFAKVDWGIFFLVLIIMACIVSAIYGFFNALSLMKLWPLIWCIPGCILIALCFGAYGKRREEKLDQERQDNIRRDELLDMHSYKLARIKEFDIKEIEERLKMLEIRAGYSK